MENNYKEFAEKMEKMCVKDGIYKEYKYNNIIINYLLYFLYIIIIIIINKFLIFSNFYKIIK